MDYTFNNPNPKPLAIGDKVEVRSDTGDELTYTSWIEGIVSGLDGNSGFFVKVNLMDAFTGIRSPVSLVLSSRISSRTRPIWRAWSTENKYWRLLPKNSGNPL